MRNMIRMGRPRNWPRTAEASSRAMQGSFDLTTIILAFSPPSWCGSCAASSARARRGEAAAKPVPEWPWQTPAAARRRPGSFLCRRRQRECRAERGAGGRGRSRPMEALCGARLQNRGRSRRHRRGGSLLRHPAFPRRRKIGRWYRGQLRRRRPAGLQNLLAKDVYGSFAAALAEREEARRKS